MAHLIKNTAIVLLIVCVVISTFLAVLSIWDVLSRDVLSKSLSTIGVVAFASLITILAAKAMEDKDPNITINSNSNQPPRFPNQ